MDAMESPEFSDKLQRKSSFGKRVSSSDRYRIISPRGTKVVPNDFDASYSLKSNSKNSKDFESTLLSQRQSVLGAYPHIQKILEQEENEFKMSNQKNETNWQVSQLNTPLYPKQRPQTSDGMQRVQKEVIRKRRPKSAVESTKETIRVSEDHDIILTRRKGKYDGRVTRKGEKSIYLGKFKTSEGAWNAGQQMIFQLSHPKR